MKIHIAVFVFAALLAEACVNDSERDTNRPPTFGAGCENDTDVCKTPFTCLEGTAYVVPYCSKTCESDADCPSWVAVGHCAGPTQSTCDDVGVCNPVGCQ